MFQLKFDPKTKISEVPFVVVDTETTGKYPMGHEVCEIAAIRVLNGQIQGRFESLIRPRRPMDVNVIQIHGISNAMVESAPSPRQVLTEFLEFIRGGVLVGHHSPFDLGFLSAGFYELGLQVPQAPAVCTSLFSRRIIPEAENHRLKTLSEFLKMSVTPEHRAMADTQACLELLQACIGRLSEPTWDHLTRAQGGEIQWSRFDLAPYLAQPEWKEIFDPLYAGPVEADLVYSAGSRPGESRPVKVIGFVRSLNGDFLVADDGEHPKRFFTEQISSIRRRLEV